MATNAELRTLPSHVPADLLTDVDIFNLPDRETDPHVSWRAFKGKGPLVYSPLYGGHWVVTCGADVWKFFRDTEHFSSKSVSIPDPGADRMIPVETDPPAHTQYRANIQGLFSPKAVEELTPSIRTLTIELIEGFHAKGECEFMRQFALQLPLTVFLRMMGLPLEDRWLLRKQIEAYISSTDIPTKVAAHAELHKYLETWIAKRSAEPGDDAITRVNQSKFNGRPYTHEEKLGTLTLLLHAGLDTVANMFGFFALHLARNPQHREYIRNNEARMDNIIQELLRRYSGPNLARVVTMDYTYKGVFMKQGDRIMFPTSLFNMDEDTLTNPDAVDFERASRHVTFGAGPHTCAGALLARRELAIFLHEFLARIPDFVVDPERPVKMYGAPQNTVAELWLKWAV